MFGNTNKYVISNNLMPLGKVFMLMPSFFKNKETISNLNGKNP